MVKLEIVRLTAEGHFRKQKKVTVKSKISVYHIVPLAGGKV